MIVRVLTDLDEVQSRLERAQAERTNIARETTAYRLVNARGDGLPGLTIDRFVDVDDPELDVYVVSLYEELSAAAEYRLIDCIATALHPHSIYLKRRPREAKRRANTERSVLAPVDPVWGEPVPVLTVGEGTRCYEIRPGGDLSVGLFLDMRPTRDFLEDFLRDQLETRLVTRSLRRSLSVLNTFAYTCGFGIAAKQAGAERVLNIDLSRRVLDWGEHNYLLNGFQPDRHDFVAGDVFDWLSRFVRRQETFDVVVLDPPSFSTAGAAKQAFSVERYDRLVALVAPLVAPGGLLVAACNHSGISRQRFLGLLERGLVLDSRAISVQTELAAGPDFPTAAGEEGALKVVVLSFGR